MDYFYRKLANRITTHHFDQAIASVKQSQVTNQPSPITL
jgi:hypothetical protein